MAQLQTLENVVNPIEQLTRAELRGRLIAFGRQNAENRFIAGDTLYGIENSRRLIAEVPRA